MGYTVSDTLFKGSRKVPGTVGDTAVWLTKIQPNRQAKTNHRDNQKVNKPNPNYVASQSQA